MAQTRANVEFTITFNSKEMRLLTLALSRKLSLSADIQAALELEDRIHQQRISELKTALQVAGSKENEEE